MRNLIAVALLFVCVSASAQPNLIELVRQDLKTQKVAIIGASLPLSEKQAETFWPIYREYDHELSKLGDRRLAVLKEYAEHLENMDDKRAERLMTESFSIAGERNELLQKYYRSVAKALGVGIAARFVQVENQMLTLIDAQISSEIPLLNVPSASGEPKK